MKTKGVTIIERIANLTLSFLLVISSFSFMGMFADSYAEEEEEVIEIRTVEDLYAINNNMSGNYKLMNDIDMSEATAEGGAYDFNNAGWDPIGYNHTSTLKEFKGTFDGDGHKITGLKVSATNGSYAGLFGCIGLIGEVKNLTVNGNSTDDDYAGMISGENKGTIIHCINCGHVSGNKSAGGITGNNKGHIYFCENKGSISSNLYAGGLAGDNTGEIENCSNTGLVSSSLSYSDELSVAYSGTYNDKVTSGEDKGTEGPYAGGVSGRNNGTIMKCYNNGGIKIYSYVSRTLTFRHVKPYGVNQTYVYNFDCNLTLHTKGYVGGVAGYNNGTISNTYNKGDVTSYDSISLWYSNCEYLRSFIGDYNYNTFRGGIAGYSTNAVCYSYNLGTVSHEDIAKWNYSTNDSKDTVTRTHTHNYGISNTVCNCCYSNYMYAYTSSGNLPTGENIITGDALKLASSFSGFDFDNVWTINSNYEYPYPQLRDNMQSTDKVIDSVSWRNKPKKIKYYVGEDLDLNGGSIRVYYIDGTSEVISLSNDMISGFDGSTAGTKTLTVTHRGYTLEYQVEVIEEPEIVSVEEVSGPNKTEFVKGTELDYSGWVIQVNYADETTRTIKISSDMATGVDNSKTGEYVAEYSYGEYTFQHDITITPVLITGIKVKKAPTKTSYILGEEISMDGLKVVLKYNDGTTKVTTDYKLGEYQKDKLGTQSIEVSYEGGEQTFKDAFDITIEQGTAVKLTIETPPSKTQYVEGEKFDTKGMVVKAEYSNGVVLPVTDYTYSEISKSLGEQTIVVSYQDVTADVSVNVIARQMQSLTLSHLPNKTQYTQGQETDKTGLVITANYNDGSKEKVEDYTLSGFNTNTLGTHIVVATYGGFSVDFIIKVTEPESTSIFAETELMKKRYLKGEELDLTGLVVKANYNNGKTKIIEDYEVDGFTGEVGLNLVVISFEGLECTIPTYVHIATGEWVTIVKPTCTTKGKRVQYCTDCGEVAISEEIDALEHNYGEWNIDEEATCIKEGSKSRVCARCKHVETKSIDKIEHNWDTTYTIDKKASLSEDGSKSIHCSGCETTKDTTTIAHIKSIELLDDKILYDGNAKTPDLFILDTNNQRLNADEDYTVEYVNNKKAGKAKALVAFKGSYQGNSVIEFTIEPAKPAYVLPTGLTAVYGQTLADVKLTDGFEWMDDSQSVGNVGTNTFKIKYTPSDTDNYSIIENIDVGVKVTKATPSYTAPTGLKATYGDTLADIKLDEGFTWMDSSLSVGNVGTNTFKVKYTSSDTDNYKVVKDIEVEVEVRKANPSYTLPTGLTATYGETLADVELSDSKFAWDDETTSVGTVGTHKFAATYTPTDTANYNTVAVELEVKVTKATPSYTAPTGLKATYGDTLADVKLGEGFTWMDSSLSVGNAGTNKFKVKYTPADTDNYKVVQDIEVEVEVGKANPSYTLPTGLTATYGQTLADVKLGEGFTWMDSSLSVGNAGTNKFKVKYTPADTANYNAVAVELEVKVTKADPSYTAPTGLKATYGDTLADIKLLEGFTWMDSSLSVGNVGTNKFKVKYTPSDTDNYKVVKDIEVEVEVTKATPSYTATTGLKATYGDTLADIKLDDGFTWMDSSLSVGNAGTNKFKVKYTPANTDNYKVVKDIEIEVEVAKATPAGDAITASLAQSEYTFDNSLKTPDVTVVSSKGVTLTSGDDYTVAYTNNKNAGTATSTITLKGNYSGTIEKSFVINAANKSNVSVTLGETSLVYTSKALMPTVSVTGIGGSALNKGSDYEIAYSDNTNVGTASVTVSLKGNYAGTITKEFEISEADGSKLTTTLSDTEYVYDAKSKTPHPIITGLDGKTLTKGDDYTVEYSNNTNAGDATATITFKGNYEGTQSKSFKIKALSVDAKLTKTSFNYKGKAIEPEFEILASAGLEPQEGTDYTVEYSDNDEPGTGHVTLTFSGNYAGQVVKDFEINRTYNLCGSIQTAGAETEVRAELYDNDGVKQDVDLSDRMFGLQYVDAGQYTLRLYGSGEYVTRDYKLTVGDDIDEVFELFELGDANCDGVRTAEDVTKVARHLARLDVEKDEYSLKLFDTDKTGSLSMSDATKLARRVANIISTFE